MKAFNRNFILMIIGQIISLFGNAILRFSLSLYVLQVTGSASIFATILAVSILPTILLSPFGGILADRVSRRSIMLSLDFLTSFLIFGFSMVSTRGVQYCAGCHTHDLIVYHTGILSALRTGKHSAACF